MIRTDWRHARSLRWGGKKEGAYRRVRKADGDFARDLSAK
jgi:hypothetical protein